MALLLAGTKASRESHEPRIAQLARRVDFTALEQLLRRHGMLSLIGGRLVALGTIEPPGAFREGVERYTALVKQQSARQALLTAGLVAAFEKHAIRVLPLKGSSLGERLYGESGARVSTDIDLLMNAADLARATEVVCTFGYERYRYAPSHGGPRHPLHERLVHPRGLPPVELHWRVHWYEERFSADLLSYSTPGADGLLQPTPTYELVELLLLYARDGFAGLRLAADIAAWWDRYQTNLEPVAALAPVALAYPALVPALATATVLAQTLVGVPAPRLLSPSILARASRSSMRLANWTMQGSVEQISANISLVDWALAPPGQLWGALRRNLLLSREALLYRAPDAATGRFPVLRLRVLHAIRVLGRYANAAWVLIRRGYWVTLPDAERLWEA